MTAVAVIFLTVVLLAWRRPLAVQGQREPFLPAPVAARRYVRHKPLVRRILLRRAAFRAAVPQLTINESRTLAEIAVGQA